MTRKKAPPTRQIFIEMHTQPPTLLKDPHRKEILNRQKNSPLSTDATLSLCMVCHGQMFECMLCVPLMICFSIDGGIPLLVPFLVRSVY